MIEQTCKICGEKFMAKQSNYTLCSDTCRKVNRQNLKRVYNAKNRLRFIENSRRYYKLHHKYKHNPCAICGQPLPDSRAKFCLGCLLKEYKNGKRRWAYKVLVCRGFDLEMINDELAQMR